MCRILASSLPLRKSASFTAFAVALDDRGMQTAVHTRGKDTDSQTRASRHERAGPLRILRESDACQAALVTVVTTCRAQAAD